MNLSVSELVRSIKSVLDQHPSLQNVKVVGEISNLTKHRSGHWYFSLKDDKSRINCVMFSTNNRSVNFDVKEGNQVLVSGMTTVYIGSGQLQLVCSTMSLAGEGLLYQQYLELRSKLHKEGLFDEQFKKTIPKYPRRIGVVAGHQSAALADILKTLHNRWPIAEVVVFESLVQGTKASEELIRKLNEADQLGLDTIILARGGGSLEDLWAFNNEALARFIFAMKTPIITGVGHEVDVTLVDYVADMRGLTPTAAAQIATPIASEVVDYIHQIAQQIQQKVLARLKAQQNQLQQLGSHRYFQVPSLLVHQQSMQLKQLDQRLSRFSKKVDFLRQEIQSALHTMQRKLSLQLENEKNFIQQAETRMVSQIDRNYRSHENQLRLLISQLDGLSPLKAMGKGLVLTNQDNQRIIKVDQINPAKPLYIDYIDGRVETKVLSLEKGMKYGKA